MGDLEELFNRTEDVQVSGIVATLMISSMRETNHVTATLLDVYKKEAEEYKAELATIRHNVARAMSGPWMPTSNHIMTCLYPTREEIREFLNEQQGSM